MSSLAPSLSAPWEALVVCLLLLVAPAVASQKRSPRLLLAGPAGSVAVALFASDGVVAYIGISAGAILHALAARRWSRTGAVTLAASAAIALATAAALYLGQPATAFALSSLAIALRAGVLPLHAGVASLCERAPLVQTQQLASTIALVFVHLRHVDHHPVAIEWAPLLVRYGSLAALAAALIVLVQKDLRGFYRGTTSMHGGMLLAAVGAASIGNFAAALLVAVAMGLALGGLGIMITSLEVRTGAAAFGAPGGRAGAFPRLASSFALFGGAGVGLPGTAGFVADDLLLHALWMESPASTVVMILSSAFLAVATLMAFSSVFLGRTVPSLAPDLHLRERVVAVALVSLLLVLGFAPGVLLGPADAFLSSPP